MNTGIKFKKAHKINKNKYKINETHIMNVDYIKTTHVSTLYKVKNNQSKIEQTCEKKICLCLIIIILTGTLRYANC